MTITPRTDTGVLENYTGSLSQHIKNEYRIPEENYRGDIKRGLRNSDGTGVAIGVTRVGSVQGYMIEDGFRIPVPGQLYYRGIELNEIVEEGRNLRLRGGGLSAAHGLSPLPVRDGPLQPDHERRPAAAQRLHRGHDHEEPQ